MKCRALTPTPGFSNPPLGQKVEKLVERLHRGWLATVIDAQLELIIRSDCLHPHGMVWRTVH